MSWGDRKMGVITIYSATTPHGLKYIGQTKRPLKQRIYEHCLKASKVSKDSGTTFHKAIAECGKDRIVWKVEQEFAYDQDSLESEKAARQLADVFEKDLIAKYQTRERDYGYNSRDGGTGFRDSGLTDEERDARDRERNRKWSSEWYAKPENRAHAARLGRSWRIENRERKSVRSRQWYANPENKARHRTCTLIRLSDPEKLRIQREYRANWAADPANKTKIAEYSARHRAKKLLIRQGKEA